MLYDNTRLYDIACKFMDKLSRGIVKIWSPRHIFKVRQLGQIGRKGFCVQFSSNVQLSSHFLSFE